MDYQCIVAATDGTSAARYAVEAAARAGLPVRCAPPPALRGAALQPPWRPPTSIHRTPGHFSTCRQERSKRPWPSGCPGSRSPAMPKPSVPTSSSWAGRSDLAASRRLLGDTGDAVARRAAAPCLFVPPVDRFPGRMLAALDGTERGLMVDEGGQRFRARRRRPPAGSHGGAGVWPTNPTTWPRCCRGAKRAALAGAGPPVRGGSLALRPLGQAQPVGRPIGPDGPAGRSGGADPRGNQGEHPRRPGRRISPGRAPRASSRAEASAAASCTAHAAPS